MQEKRHGLLKTSLKLITNKWTLVPLKVVDFATTYAAISHFHRLEFGTETHAYIFSHYGWEGLAVYSGTVGLAIISSISFLQFAANFARKNSASSSPSFESKLLNTAGLAIGGFVNVAVGLGALGNTAGMLGIIHV